ncbi:IspD/TarI family cytidylyltransferase [[Clostridium] fimetarium]|uniref:2-C-methyl-D-erythritol 4-phosphate cytidylyltransferase n=1 Tax=[Clostridium] fimetarium TaxID=99656 RepID=A0A1I0P433_9FIRM|nr:2-C-methyl-D-erythritol 4-phosphate cytidylyltransferase [[Clostridium] fimetarium]SEW09113.1 2-C-methyl-D-erythritol 4-phosphate cytidylyltransferase [[Clostridium] fimetarium]
MITTAILSGGLGTRMGNSSVPKQFLEMNGEPIINRTVDALLLCNSIDKVLIVIHPEWRQYLINFIKTKSWYSITDIIDGGTSRIDSIENAVNYLHEKYIDEDENIILLHDAVRPFINKKLIDTLIENVRIYHAVSPSVPVIDTLFWSENGQVIESIPQRNNLYHGQTPEAFDVALIRDCIFKLTKEQREQNTGTAQICTVQGVSVHMIKGDQSNIKITTKEDYMLANYYFESIL